MANTKNSPWKLSADGLTYTNTFTEDANYQTTVQDVWGNQTVVWLTIQTSIGEICNIDSTKYKGYKEALEALQEKHPNWKIRVMYTGLDWEEVIENEDAMVGNSPKSLTQAPYLGAWKKGDETYDVTNDWYRATKSAIRYMMDPRNSLEEAWIFQFQNLSSASGTREQIKKMVKGTFLSNDSVIDCIIEVAKAEGISPFHIVSRIIQEQGADGRGVMNGYRYNGTTVYNLFNINVSGNGVSGLTAGAKYAYDREWFTPEASIRGGASFLKKNYISKGQNTLYFQKYNVVDKDNLYSHQYMQNIRAANDEGNKMYISYVANGILESHFDFIIPIYENMPSTACPRPATK